MELMPEPMALPGCCFKCRAGSNNRDFFVDLEFSIDFHGAVYICNECIAEMAHAAGYILPEEARRLRFETNFYKEEVEELTTKVFGLEQAIDGLRIAGRSVGVIPESDDSGALSTESEVPRTGQEELDFGTGEPAESVYDEGMAELSNDDSGVTWFEFSI